MSDTNPSLTSFTQRNDIHRGLRTLIQSFQTHAKHRSLGGFAEELKDLANRVEALKVFTVHENASLCFEVKCNRITACLTQHSELARTRPNHWQEIADVLDMVLIQMGRLTLTGDDSEDDLAQDAELLAEDKVSLLPREEDEVESRSRRFMYGLWCQLTYNTVAGCWCMGCREDREWNELDEIEWSSQDEETDEDEEMYVLCGSARVANP